MNKQTNKDNEAKDLTDEDIKWLEDTGIRAYEKPDNPTENCEIDSQFREKIHDLFDTCKYPKETLALPISERKIFSEKEARFYRITPDTIKEIEKTLKEWNVEPNEKRIFKITGSIEKLMAASFLTCLSKDLDEKSTLANPNYAFAFLKEYSARITEPVNSYKKDLNNRPNNNIKKKKKKKKKK
jgi:hypothetical protein